MKLSVIIVNYNVRAYLEQCLRTVFEAMKGIDGRCVRGGQPEHRR